MSLKMQDKGGGWLTRQRQKDYTPYLVFTIPLAFLVIFLFWPLVTTFIRAFLGSGSRFSLGPLTVSNFERFATSNLYRGSLRNSFIISFSVVFFTLLIGVPMGYFVARVKMPFKRLILSLGILPIILPSFVGAFSWVILLGRQGFVRHYINMVLGVFGLELPSIYGLFGVIFTMTVTYYPFIFLLSYGSFEAVNPLLEEGGDDHGFRAQPDFAYHHIASGHPEPCGRFHPRLYPGHGELRYPRHAWR